MTIHTVTTVAVRVDCDAVGCDKHFETSTDVGLKRILSGMGWWIGEEEPPTVYCPRCTAAKQALGDLGPQAAGSRA